MTAQPTAPAALLARKPFARQGRPGGGLVATHLLLLTIGLACMPLRWARLNVTDADVFVSGLLTPASLLGATAWVAAVAAAAGLWFTRNPSHLPPALLLATSLAATQGWWVLHADPLRNIAGPAPLAFTLSQAMAFTLEARAWMRAGPASAATAAGFAALAVLAATLVGLASFAPPSKLQFGYRNPWLALMPFAVTVCAARGAGDIKARTASALLAILAAGFLAGTIWALQTGWLSHPTLPSWGTWTAGACLGLAAWLVLGPGPRTARTGPDVPPS